MKTSETRNRSKCPQHDREHLQKCILNVCLNGEAESYFLRSGLVQVYPNSQSYLTLY